MSHSILASVSGLLRGLVEFHGLDAQSFFEGLGIPVDAAHPHTRLPAEVMDAAWLRAQALILDPCFGLQAHRCWHPSHLGVLGHAWLASSTLRTALGRLARYARTVTDRAGVTLAEAEGGLLVRFDAERQQGQEIPALVDATLAMLMDMCRVNYGEALDPLAVSLRRPPPPCAGRYFAYFRAPVAFGARENHLVLPLPAVDRPLSGANSILARMHDEVMTQYLARLAVDDVVARVRAHVLEALPTGETSPVAVASALNLGERTLARRLREAGTSFRQIRDETRRDLALAYVRNHRMSLTEIAYLLGFSDSSAFTRAFRRWTGAPPRAAR